MAQKLQRSQWPPLYGNAKLRNGDEEASSSQILSKALVGKDDMLADIDAVVNRFAPQTGQVADVDRHMYVNPTLYLTHFLIQPLTC